MNGFHLLRWRVEVVERAITAKIESPHQLIADPSGIEIQLAARADFDRDGVVDVAMAGRYRGAISVLWGSLNGQFETATFIDLPVDESVALRAADLVPGGPPELVFLEGGRKAVAFPN